MDKVRGQPAQGGGPSPMGAIHPACGLLSVAGENLPLSGSWTSLCLPLKACDGYVAAGRAEGDITLGESIRATMIQGANVPKHGRMGSRQPLRGGRRGATRQMIVFGEDHTENAAEENHMAQDVHVCVFKTAARFWKEAHQTDPSRKCTGIGDGCQRRLQ